MNLNPRRVSPALVAAENFANGSRDYTAAHGDYADGYEDTAALWFHTQWAHWPRRPARNFDYLRGALRAYELLTGDPPPLSDAFAARLASRKEQTND